MENMVLHPEDGKEVLYWTKKWGVSKRQIFDAILDTGSIDLIKIKKRLKQKGALRSFPQWFYKLASVL